MSNAKAKLIHKNLLEFTRLYDNNEFQRGLRLTNKVLKTFPDNAEFMAWKAIFLQSTKSPKEALETITSAVQKDMRNAKVWKMNGIIYREQEDYTKALQAFTMSYRLDSTDEAVLQELCNLHLYERNKAPFLQHSYKFLSVSSNASSVVRYAVALHLSGRVKNAISWLNTYEQQFMPTTNEDETLFRNELFIYHATLLQEAEMYQECINYLLKNQKNIRDSVVTAEKLAKCFLKLGNVEEYLKYVRHNLDYYPEDGDYFSMLEKVLTPEEYIEELFKIKGSRYAQVRILELLDINDTRFRDLLKEYLVPYLIKGAPSLFITVQELSQEKLLIAKEIADSAEVPISSVPVVKIFDANISISRGDYENALASVNAAIEHTPTNVEAMALKIRILRRIGRIDDSVKIGKELAEADPNDRNSSTLYVNALLRDGKLKTAFDEAQPFSIDSKKNPKLLLTQYNDFHVRVADCTYRAKEYDIAVQFYENILKHFDDFRKSQYNYLAWGMRHVSSLYDVLKWSDDLPKHAILARGMFGLMKIHFLRKDLKSLAPIALRATFSDTPSSLAYAAIFFALHNEPLPALKCFKRCVGPWKYAARPAIVKMMNNLPDKIPALVKEVATELYEPFNGEPQGFLEKLSDVRGRYIAGDDSAKNALVDIVKNTEYNYKEGLDAYTVANNEMNDEGTAKLVQEAINTKYHTYQLVFEYEKSEIPVEIDDD